MFVVTAKVSWPQAPSGTQRLKIHGRLESHTSAPPPKAHGSWLSTASSKGSNRLDAALLLTCRPESAPAVWGLTLERGKLRDDLPQGWVAKRHRRKDTHISKLGYYVLALVVPVEAVPGAKVFGSRYRLLIVGGVGAGIYV